MKRWFSLYVVTLCALLLGGISSPALATGVSAPAAASSCDGSEGVYLYDGALYSGRCIRLIGDDIDLSDEAFNNIASSIRIIGDWTATLYVDQGYTGDSSTFTDDDSNLSDNR